MIASALQTLPGFALSVFLVFCRIGTCLMLIPGYGSARVPVQVRLIFSLGASLAIFSALGELEGVRQSTADVPALARLIAVEAGKGALIGFMARFFFASLQFLAEAAAHAMGLSFAGTSAEDDQSLPAIASLISLTATALFFITDQHLEILQALLRSYHVLGFGADLEKGASMANLISAMGAASLLSLHVCAPFLVYAIIVNILFGILNKLAPQIPVYFISPPFVVAAR